MSERFTVLVTADAEEASQQAAAIVAEHVNDSPETLLCAASGNTPTRTYALLGAMAAQRQLSTSL